MSTNRDATETPKDALGYDAISTYTINDGLGINALPDSKKYKKGIRENTTGRARTLGILMSCPDCSFNKKFQEFIPRDHQYELTEDIERKECPDPDCKSKNFSVFMAEKDTVFYPIMRLKGVIPWLFFFDRIIFRVAAIRQDCSIRR
jgi:hypothetical protein